MNDAEKVLLNTFFEECNIFNNLLSQVKKHKYDLLKLGTLKKSNIVDRSQFKYSTFQQSAYIHNNRKDLWILCDSNDTFTEIDIRIRELGVSLECLDLKFDYVCNSYELILYLIEYLNNKIKILKEMEDQKLIKG